MSGYFRRCWATVDLDRIAHNTALLRKNAGPAAKMLAAVKADGYGHGDVEVARRLEAEGVEWFGVSNLLEALRLRDHGIRGHILIFGPTPVEYAAELVKLEISQTVHSAPYAGELSAAAQKAGVELEIHIKADTGMNRIGFSHLDVEGMETACRLPAFHSQGIFTHFACSDGATADERAFTEGQFQKFTRAIRQLENRGVSFSLRHCCNSAATMQYPRYALDLVRCGIAIYGLAPSPALKGTMDLQPAMDWHAVVTMVKELRPGDTVSYGRTFTADRPMRAATVAMGYGDGYPRLLSNRGGMLVRGETARVLGRVCMDQLVLDVTHIDGVAEGDVVTVSGSDGERSVSLDDIADACGTINYETACLVGKRVPRIYRSNKSGDA